MTSQETRSKRRGFSGHRLTVGEHTADERTRQSDSDITLVVQAALVANEAVKARAVEVQTREGIVYLTRLVGTEEARREAERIASEVKGVTDVNNELLVGRIGG